MPEQKGKRRNRQRRRGGMGFQDVDVASTSSPVSPPTTAQRTRRTGFQLPLWGNVLVATVIAIVALILFLLPTKGSNLQYRLLFFVAYLALSGLYWFKAYRQYRGRPGTQ